MNWWVQNMQHLPQAPVPHAAEGFTEFPAGRKTGHQHLAQVPRRHARNHGINIPPTTFGIRCTEQPHQSLAILGTGQPSPFVQEGFASRQWEKG